MGQGQRWSHRPQPQSAGLLEGARGGTKNGALANVTEALRR
jgi:hypothetical protein